MDLSLEAIEQDLNRAEQALGRPEAAIHSQRALVRATLRGQTSTGPDASPIHIEPGSFDIRELVSPDGSVYLIPTGAALEDRLEVAARILNWDKADLRGAMDEFTAITFQQGSEDDDTEDVFAEVRKAKKK